MEHSEQILDLLITGGKENIELAKSLCESVNINERKILKDAKIFEMGFVDFNDFRDLAREVNGQIDFTFPLKHPNTRDAFVFENCQNLNLPYIPSNIKWLKFENCTICNLDGILKMPFLNELIFQNCKIHCIFPLQTTLKELRIENTHCYQYLKLPINLDELFIVNSIFNGFDKKLPNITKLSIKNMEMIDFELPKKLNTIRLWDTNLKNVDFLNDVEFTEEICLWNNNLSFLPKNLKSPKITIIRNPLKVHPHRTYPTKIYPNINIKYNFKMQTPNKNRYQSIPSIDQYDTNDENLQKLIGLIYKPNNVYTITEKMHGANVSFHLYNNKEKETFMETYKREYKAEESFYEIYKYTPQVEEKLKALKGRYFPNDNIQVYSEYVGNGIHGHTNIPYFGDEHVNDMVRREFFFLDIWLEKESRFLPKKEAFSMFQEFGLLTPAIVYQGDEYKFSPFENWKSIFNPNVEGEGFVLCVEMPNKTRQMFKFINAHFSHNKKTGVEAFIRENEKTDSEIANVIYKMIGGVTINRLEDRIAEMGVVTKQQYNEIKQKVIADILSEYDPKYCTLNIRRMLVPHVDKLLHKYFNKNKK